MNDAFLLFIRMRMNNGEKLAKEQILLLKEQLLSLTDKTEEQIAIVKKSTVSNWKNFYPSRKVKASKKESGKNRFNNFPQREYDWDKMEGDLLLAESDKNN